MSGHIAAGVRDPADSTPEEDAYWEQLVSMKEGFKSFEEVYKNVPFVHNAVKAGMPLDCLVVHLSNQILNLQSKFDLITGQWPGSFHLSGNVKNPS